MHRDLNKTIFSVVGPTASGKTACALRLAHELLQQKTQMHGSGCLGVDLISVDSRQVYRELQIISGADIPNDFIATKDEQLRYEYYQQKSAPIALHGVSFLEARQDWSVAHFKLFATEIITRSFALGRVPILVGGTGLYHKQLFCTDSAVFIPPNKSIRKKAQTMTVSALQNWLEKTDLQTFSQMNHSDRQNPRRLIRALEKAYAISKSHETTETTETTHIHQQGEDSSPLKPSTKQTTFRANVRLPKVQLPNVAHYTKSVRNSKKIDTNPLFLYNRVTYGLQPDLETVKKNIKIRVQERFAQGAPTEVARLRELCKTQATPACSALGVQELSTYLTGESTKEECQKQWALHEFQYAKRQMTWFRAQPDIIWLDDWQKKRYTIFK